MVAAADGKAVAAAAVGKVVAVAAAGMAVAAAAQEVATGLLPKTTTLLASSSSLSFGSKQATGVGLRTK